MIRQNYIWAAVSGILSIVCVVYFVNRPGGRMAARILNYDTILQAYREHLLMVAVASLAAIVVSVSLGVLITRPFFRRGAPLVDNVVNIAQTVPSLAVLALFFIYLGRGFNTAIFALWLYALLPIMRNTSTGIQSISPDIIEAARGMGMNNRHILLRMELPLALPVIMAGVRTSVVITVGAATLASFIGAGGLGDLIIPGLVAGGILIALLAILLDRILGNLEIYAQR